MYANSDNESEGLELGALFLTGGDLWTGGDALAGERGLTGSGILTGFGFGFESSGTSRRVRLVGPSQYDIVEDDGGDCFRCWYSDRGCCGCGDGKQVDQCFSSSCVEV